MHRLSQFPTPYPDECYYSILCRYHQRMGYFSFDRTMKSLFGKTHHAEMFILLPYLAAFVNDWTGNHPKLNAEVITNDHTAFIYCSLAEWTWCTRTEQKNRLWNGSSRYHTGFRSVKKEQLCYCPECAGDERKIYGEAYWHRLHQISNVTVCEKHGINLQSSGVTFEKTKHGFYPASLIIQLGEHSFKGNNTDMKNGIQFAEDVKWILDNGDRLPSSGMLRRYLKNKKCIQNEKGDLKASEIGVKDFENFYTVRSGERLFEQLYLKDHLYEEYIPFWIFDFFKPMAIVLMMEYLEGSSEAFYRKL